MIGEPLRAALKTLFASFLSCLRGSERTSLVAEPFEEFLSCLRGSERVGAATSPHDRFLS